MRNLAFVTTGLLGLPCLSGCGAEEKRPFERPYLEPPDTSAVQFETVLERPACDTHCLEAYENLPLNFETKAPPISEAELERELLALFRAPAAVATQFTKEELEAQIRRGLNADFMFEGRWERPLTATLRAVEDDPSYHREHYLLSDAIVGAFDLRVLMPFGEGPHPAILSLHGHDEGGRAMEDHYMGRELAELGFAVVMPQFRAMRCTDRFEGEISLALLQQGFTLMGLQVYEAFLARKFVEAHPDLDGSRVGLLSHSGGSSTANLLVHLSPRFDAQVTDYFVDWRNRCPTSPIGAHCETIPALFALGPQISSADTLSLPRMAVRYGFNTPGIREDIIAFFRTWVEPPKN